MSNYSTLKTAIQQAVYTNGNGEITGAGLQTVLLQIIDTVGSGYNFMGVATAGTSPGTPDANVFYIAPAGTYANFGSSYIVPFGSIGVFSYNGSWSHAHIELLTSEPAEKVNNIGEVAIGELPWSKLEEGLVMYSNGADGAASASYRTDYIDISGITRIEYARGCATNNTSVAGMAFYDSSKSYISGQRFVLNQAQQRYEKTLINVPSGAVYARFTILRYVDGFFARNAYNLVEGSNRCVFATGITIDGNTFSFDRLYVTENGMRDFYTNNGRNVAESAASSFTFTQASYLVLHPSAGTFELIDSANYAQIAEDDLILLFGSPYLMRSGLLGAQLAQYKGEKSDYIHTWEGGDGFIIYSTGNVYSGTTTKYTDYVTIGGVKKLVYARMVAPSTTTTAGLAFYDANKTYISGERCIFNRSNLGYIDSVVDVPEGAAFVRFSYWTDDAEGFYAMRGDVPAGNAFFKAARSFEKAYQLLGRKVSILGDSISCDGTETQTREEGYNAPYFIIKPIDVGQTIQSYVTWLDVYTSVSSTTPTGKTIGGITLTAAMIGTLQTFTPVAEDVGKEIGVARWASKYANTVWWRILLDQCGATLVNNASWSGSGICKVPVGNPDHDAFVLSEAYSDYTIGRLARRDDDGTLITPEVVIIYRGTNDFIRTNGTSHMTITTPDMMQWTDITDEMNMTQCYIKTILKIRAAYPNAYIILCTLNTFKRVNYSSWPVNNGVNTLPDYSNKIREIADLMGCGVIEFDKDGITYENCYPDYISDSETQPLHPNTKGHRVLADKAFADINYIFRHKV